MLLLLLLRVGTSTARFPCASPVQWRSHPLCRGSRSTLTWARLLFKVFGAMGCLGSRHGNILFHVSFFVISLFFFRCAILSHGKLAGGKKSHLSCLLHDWILYIMGIPIPSIHLVSFSKFPLLFSFPLFYSSPVRHRAKLGMLWPSFWPCHPNIEPLSDIY